MNPWLDDGDVQLDHGDCLDVLASLPAGSVQTCVTSPPYWGLRDYGTGSWTGGDAECDHAAPPTGGPNPERYTPGGGEMWRRSNDKLYQDTCGKCGARRVDQQLGLEESPTMYVERLVEVFRGVWRVLRDDGTVWLNLGDSYNSGTQFNPSPKSVYDEGLLNGHRALAPGLKPKDLVGIPWRVAFALQADGWYLRSDIIWAKPNPMPESVTDRPTKSHEYLFLLSKQPRYYWDADAIREPQQESSVAREAQARLTPYAVPGQTPQRRARPKVDASRNDAADDMAKFTNPLGRNVRSVWEIATQPTPEAHFATFPEELVRRCILAGTSERGECVECGAPWRRVVEREKHPTRDVEAQRAYYAERNGRTDGHVSGPSGMVDQTQTVGWEASCTCSAPTRPQQVLDPFMGSGTTALVARKHGRHAVGIELSSEYLGIAERRLQQLSLFGVAHE